MISQEQIRIFLKYRGRIDKYMRSASSKELAILSHDDWIMIESFLQDCEMISKGLTSESFKKDFEKRLTKELNGQLLNSEFYQLFKIKPDKR